jgi:hypothetical protein
VSQNDHIGEANNMITSDTIITADILASVPLSFVVGGLWADLTGGKQ